MKQLKRILTQRPEPLLLIVPLLLFAINKIFISDALVDAQGQERNLLQLDSSILFWIIFVFIVVPFLLHFLLKASGKWDAAVCRPHVYLTVAFSVLLFIAFYADMDQAPLPGAYFEHTAGGNLAQLTYSSKPFIGILLLEFMLQFLFTVYFLIRIFQKHGKYFPVKRLVQTSP